MLRSALWFMTADLKGHLWSWRGGTTQELSRSPSVSQSSPRKNRDGVGPVWGVEWQLIHVQKDWEEALAIFLVAMSLCSKGLRGKEAGSGEKRGAKGTRSAPAPSTLNLCTSPSGQELPFPITRKMHVSPWEHTSTTREGLCGSLEEWDSEEMGIKPASLHSSGDILWNLVSILRFPLWSLSCIVWSLQSTHPRS